MGIHCQTNWIKHWKGNINLFLEKKKASGEKKKKDSQNICSARPRVLLHILLITFREVKKQKRYAVHEVQRWKLNISDVCRCSILGNTDKRSK